MNTVAIPISKYSIDINEWCESTVGTGSWIMPPGSVHFSWVGIGKWCCFSRYADCAVTFIFKSEDAAAMFALRWL